MRYSTDEGDAGHAALMELRARGKSVRPFLNGVEQTWVQTVDTELGLLVRAVTDVNDEPQLNDEWTEVRLETLRGVVTVELRDR